MKIPTEVFISFRYLRARKNGFFSLLTTFIAIGGTMLGVAALIITLAVMSGFQTDIQNKILGVQSHIVVSRMDGNAFMHADEISQRVLENPQVVGASPFIYRQAIVRSLNTNESSGLLIKAIDYKTEDAMTDLSSLVVEQDMDFNDDLNGRRIILGQELAKSIGAFAGDEVVLMFPTDLASIPAMYKFSVAAVFYSGMYDMDSSFAFMDIGVAQDIFSMPDQVSGLGLRIKNVDDSLKLAAQIKETLGYPYSARAWIALNKNLFSALKLEKIMMFLILGLIIFVAAFNIISNLLLLSVQKFKEIGIMSAIGFSKMSIAKIFFYEGVFVGLIGAFLGVALGLGISLILKNFEIVKLPQGIYYVDKLPIAILYQDVFFVGLCAFIITIVAAIYPAYQVSKLDPIEAMRGQ
ncbi:MAG: ABC transporter permease [Elusimicrobiota bacterium]|jgi:lipoprotein-releasing system permease protein|nr:ABC transporter permease [Elusimicrobiota bacterium]